MKVSVVALAIALACNSAAAQYPVSSGWGYFNKAEALRQAQFENQQWQREQRAKEAMYLWGGDSLDYGQRAANLRKTKEEARGLRLQNDRMESQGNPYLNNPFER
jgi:hypothetical protein